VTTDSIHENGCGMQVNQVDEMEASRIGIHSMRREGAERKGEEEEEEEEEENEERHTLEAGERAAKWTVVSLWQIHQNGRAGRLLGSPQH
jgi:hypothetical protein